MRLNLTNISKVALLAFTALAFTACGEIKETDELSLTRGNVSIQDNGVYSKSKLSDKDVQVFIADFAVNQLTGSSLLANLSVNGARTTISFNPAAINTLANTIRDAELKNSDYNAYYDSRCLDQSCSLVSLVVWIGSTNSVESKQIGFLKSMVENKIVAALEKTASDNRLYTADQMSLELLSIRQAWLNEQAKKQAENN